MQVLAIFSQFYKLFLNSLVSIKYKCLSVFEGFRWIIEQQDRSRSEGDEETFFTTVTLDSKKFAFRVSSFACIFDMSRVDWLRMLAVTRIASPGQ